MTSKRSVVRSAVARVAAVIALALLCLALLIATEAPAAPSASTVAAVVVVRLEGAIGPATADHVQRAIERAGAAGAQALILQIDTPGGLDTAMRTIIKSVLGAPLPVVGYVAPSGARAASAGTYILYATHVAAMAPGTNLGAATPVAIGMPTAASAPPAADVHKAKAVNDAAAYIRALAELRGRNVAWAERAVREAASLPAGDALAQKVIDLVAADLPALLRQLDGRELTLAGGARVRLATAGAPLVQIEAGWRTRLLTALSDPNLTLVLMLIGVYGLLFEFMSLGMIAPGVVGGVCLLLALWGLQMLPINLAGMALVVLGIAFMVAEVFVPSFGVLGLGGVVAFVFGAVMLVDTELPGLGVSPGLVAAIGLVAALAIAAIGAMAARARVRPVVSGAGTLVGADGVVVAASDEEAWAEVAGERWRVRAGPAVPLPALTAGAHVRVQAVDGLTLVVAADPSSPQGDAR